MKNSCISMLLMLFTAVIFNHPQLFAQTGCLAGNCSDGVGTYRWDSGDEYTGEWHNGHRTGLGVYDWANGSYYYGFFNDGVLEGKGMYIDSNAANDLLGTFSKGQLQSTDTFPSLGCLLGNCYDGVGMFLWEDNAIYIGEWTGGLRTGSGRYDWADGSFYTGHFLDGQLDGQGQYFGKDGSEMNGTFINNQFQGKATYNDDYSDDLSGTNNDSQNSDAASNSDFCSVVQTASQDVLNNFKNMKGTYENKYQMDTWISTVKVSGSGDSRLIDDYGDGNLTWNNTLYTSSLVDDAKSSYDHYVDQLKQCLPACCTWYAVNNDHVSGNDTVYSTNWVSLSVNSGYDQAYKNVIILMTCEKDIFGQVYEVKVEMKKSAD